MKNMKVSPRLAVGLAVVAFILLAFGLYKTFARPPEKTDTKALASEIQASVPKNAPSMPSGINPSAGAIGMGSRSGRQLPRGSSGTPASGRHAGPAVSD
ncbi:MAG TPA: hypothetical protein VFA07_14810 [Chthonomonadaceae bacterium]|nr:hypothetical protein [Chthonomonadaceae bacterium]